MKNIKQIIKNKAKATGEFISEHADIIVPLAAATVTLTVGVLKVKSYNNQIKEQEKIKGELLKEQEELTKDVREFVINSITTNGEEHGWVNWGGFIYANHNQDPKELLEQMIADINNNSISIDEA